MKKLTDEDFLCIDCKINEMYRFDGRCRDCSDKYLANQWKEWFNQ